jgi:hypothetical protein
MQRTRAANILYRRRLIGVQQALQPRAAKLPTLCAANSAKLPVLLRERNLSYYFGPLLP